MATAQEEALLLGDIASLAAMINKHKAAQTKTTYQPPFSSHGYTATRFANRSLRSTPVPSTSSSSTSNTCSISTPTPNATVLSQQLVHKTQYKLVKPKPILPSTPAIPQPNPQVVPISTTASTSSPTKTPYIRRGNNKLVRQSAKTSPHKKFLLKSSTTPKSNPSSPSLRLKQFLAAATVRSPGYKRLFNNKLTPTKTSTLATYFRHGNTLVRKTSNKYVRPGVIIPNKQPLAMQRTPKGKHMTIGGQVYVKTPRGRSLVRSKKSLSVTPTNKPVSAAPAPATIGRAIASNRVKRSLKLARTKKVQYCLFYSKFGKCNRRDTCRYIHDPDKVAVCRKFLKGKCEDPNCPLQHKIDSERMPVCWHFLKGICNKDNCPYSHVYVNEDAAPCPDFQNGYCPNGKNCKLKHIYAKNPKKEKEENEKNREKRRLEEGEEEEREKRRKIEEDELAKQIRPNFSAFFGASNNTGTPSE